MNLNYEYVFALISSLNSFQNTNVDDGGFMNDLPLLKSK